MTQEERDQILLDLKTGQEELFEGQEEIKNDLRNLSQTVAKIEVDHGQKLEILLDVVTSHTEKFESIETKVDRHSDEIYYLNSKVHAF